MSRRRNYKLIIDPEIHGKQQEKQYRFDGHNAGVKGPHLIVNLFLVCYHDLPC